MLKKKLKCQMSDASMVDTDEVTEGIDRMADAMETLDREATPRQRLRRLSNGMHGACEGGESEDATEDDGATTEAVRTGTSFPSVEKGITVLVETIAQIAEGPEAHAHGEDSDEDDEAWMEREESPGSRYRRYIQSDTGGTFSPDRKKFLNQTSVPRSTTRPTLRLHPEQGQGQERPQLLAWSSNAESNTENFG